MSDLLLQRAASLIDAGRLDEAGPILQSLLRKHPGDGAVSGVLSAWHAQKGDFTRALYFAQAAVAAFPGEAGPLINLGRVLGAQGRHAESLEQFRTALERDPSSAEGWQRYAFALARADRYADAAAACARGLALAPTDRNLLIQAANVELMRGLAHEAVATLRECLRHHPSSYMAARLLAFALTYDDRADRRETFDAHALAGRLLADDMRRTGPFPAPPFRPDPDRRLRVGFVSPDLREHPVARFLAPIFAHADRGQIGFACYANSVHDDAMTAFFRERSFAFRRVVGLGARQLAQSIRADAIDILFDLAGHTAQSALPVFALRAAPVQVTWIGYPNTTGLPGVGWRIVDSITDPAPEADAFATESLARLDPCFLCYSPDAGAPEVSPPPFDAAGHVTFGSFNGYQKINDALLGLWGRVLNAVPGSRLLIKNHNLGQAEVRDHLAARVAAAGVAPDRVTLLGPAERHAEHLAAYSRVDIGLDTFPYNGTTTTCEALHMGVPVVTRAGEIHASRVGLSLLTAAGFPHWCARTDDEFVSVAAGLAGDREGLRGLRASLRPRVLASTLCDAPVFAHRFAALVRGIWSHACAKG